MKKHFILISIFILSVGIISCSAPHQFWPQNDIQMREINEPSVEKKILIAARSSDFKDAVLDKISTTFKEEPVYMKLMGLDKLKDEEADNYSAIVIINTCMAGKMDRHVKGFLKRHKDQSNTIILTTSGDGDWKPKMDKYNFDAVSSASKMQKVDEIADDIITKTKAILQSS